MSNFYKKPQKNDNDSDIFSFHVKISSLKKNLFTLLIIGGVGGAVYTSYYYYNQYQSAKELINNPGKVVANEVDSTMLKISQLIQLPTDEKPTLATVADKTKVNKQSFFRQAENGDKVLIYTNAQKAILYRPKDNKIIEVAPLNIENRAQVAGVQTSSPSAQITRIIEPSPTSMPLKVVIYNGTNAKGLGGKAKKYLAFKVKGIEILDLLNAQKADYAKTQVIRLKDVSQNMIDTLLFETGGVMGELPVGEKKPEGDILLILGSDFQQKLTQ